MAAVSRASCHITSLSRFAKERSGSYSGSTNILLFRCICFLRRVGSRSLKSAPSWTLQYPGFATISRVWRSTQPSDRLNAVGPTAEASAFDRRAEECLPHGEYSRAGRESLVQRGPSSLTLTQRRQTCFAISFQILSSRSRESAARSRT